MNTPHIWTSEPLRQNQSHIVFLIFCKIGLEHSPLRSNRPTPIYPSSPLLTDIERWQSDHTCHYSHRFNDPATTSEQWNGKPRLLCANVRHPPSKNPAVYCPGHDGVKGNDRADGLAGKATITVRCTVLSMTESKEMTEQTDWRAKQLSQVACV